MVGVRKKDTDRWTGNVFLNPTKPEVWINIGPHARSNQKFPKIPDNPFLPQSTYDHIADELLQCFNKSPMKYVGTKEEIFQQYANSGWFITSIFLLIPLFIWLFILWIRVYIFKSRLQSILRKAVESTGLSTPVRLEYIRAGSFTISREGREWVTSDGKMLDQYVGDRYVHGGPPPGWNIVVPLPARIQKPFDSRWTLDGSSVKCTNCNAPLLPNSRFCSSCGTPVSVAEPEVWESPDQQASAVVGVIVDAQVLNP